MVHTVLMNMPLKYLRNINSDVKKLVHHWRRETCDILPHKPMECVVLMLEGVREAMFMMIRVLDKESVTFPIFLLLLISNFIPL